MTTTPIVLEICRNTEWLRDNAGLELSCIDESDHNDAANAIGIEICLRLQAAGYETRSPEIHRIHYHGWQRATFRHKLGAVGTLSELTAEQEQQIKDIVGAAVDAVQAKYA